MNLEIKNPRHLDEPMRIMGLTPLELAGSGLFYAIISPLLRGVPFSQLVALVASITIGLLMLALNRTYPPHHGIFTILQLFRPKVVSVMLFGSESELRGNR